MESESPNLPAVEETRGSALDGVEIGAEGGAVAGRSATLSYDEFRVARHFPALDGLRALSVGLVYFFHTNPTLTRFLSGWEGVTTFFVLSGFLITTLLLREDEDTGRVSLAAFYTRRVFRIFPLYYAVLMLHYVLIVQLGIGSNAPQLRAAMPWDLTYMSEWGPHADSTPFAQSWSLGVEEKYYLVWPLLIVLLLRRSLRVRLGIVAVLVLVPILTLPIGLSPDRQEIVFSAYGRILIGCLAALCLHDRRIFRYVRRLGGTAWSAVVACAFVGALLLVDEQPGNLTLYAFPFVAGVFLVTIVLGSGGVAARLLSQPLVRRVGTRAYGMYLLDSIANRATGYLIHNPSGWPSTLASFVVRLALAFVLADILYRIVERPLIKVGKRLSGRLHAREAASVPRVAPSEAR